MHQKDEEETPVESYAIRWCCRRDKEKHSSEKTTVGEFTALNAIASDCH